MGGGIVLVTLWFVARRSQAAPHSCKTFFPLLKFSVNSELDFIMSHRSNVKGRVSNPHVMYGRESAHLLLYEPT